jgi:hypothetical protein
MRTSDLFVPVAALALGLITPAFAFDGNSQGSVAPAVGVEIITRGAVPNSALGVGGVRPVLASPPSAALAAPSPAPSAPALKSMPSPSLVAPPINAPSRPLDLSRKPTPTEAFRSGTTALNSGDTKAGLTALEYAAANGHPIAQWKLGQMYALGEGVKQDDLRAFEYFRGIADAHADDAPGTPQARFVANAFVALGSYFLEGIANSDVKPDADRAREMFAYAASYFGDANAQYNLGRMYLDGHGAQKDFKLAARWLGLAANKGQYQAQALLGAMLFKGDKVPRQGARGLMWLTLAMDAAPPQERWIKDLHDAAFKQASDDERQLALMLIERRLNGQRN